MAKNDRKQTSGQPVPVVKEGEPIGDAMDKADFVSTDNVPLSDRNRVERALYHLGFLVGELQGLLKDGNSLAGLVRQAAARNKQLVAGDVQEWTPVVTIRKVLTDVMERLG